MSVNQETSGRFQQMGKHYVPQAHLRRFQLADRPGFVWMYDKQRRQFSEAANSKVAQEAGFYPEDVEVALAQTVEKPGNICLDRLLARETLNNHERSQLSLYLMIMATRGPAHRIKLSDIIPGALKSSFDESREHLEKWVESSEADAPLARQRLAELKEVEDKFERELPAPILDLIKTPFWSQTTVECIHNMAWHIVPAPSGQYFVTGDTPAHFFEAFGLGTEQSEFTFPISSSYALIGEHKRRWGTVFEKPQANIVKEVNRRIISSAVRFVFASRNDVWIETVARKKRPQINTIEWI